MKNGGLNTKSQQVVFDAIYNSRQKFASLLETIRQGSTAAITLPKSVKNMPGLMGDRIKLMIGSTYKYIRMYIVISVSHHAKQLLFQRSLSHSFRLLRCASSSRLIDYTRVTKHYTAC